MFIVGLLEWWYGRGWLLQVVRLREKLFGTLDYFSIDLLMRTLFSPFRQISAGKVRGPLGVQLRAFFDQLISRIIGGMVRFAMIVVGCVTIVFHVIFGAMWLVVWLAVPVLPIIGAVLFAVRWVPWSL